MRILIIEDEYSLADVVASRLKKEKYMVDICTDGEEGFYKATTNAYDLIILDVMLPHMNGFDILKNIRKEEVYSKVIMLTAKSTLDDKLDGLENGANDYVTKPFHIDELVARINIQLKGSSGVKSDVISYGDLKLNTSNSKLTCITTKETVELVCKEFQLLEYFFNNPTQILSKDQIYYKVWGIDNDVESNNLEVYLSFIRRKLKALGTKVNIKAARGLGYKLEVCDE